MGNQTSSDQDGQKKGKKKGDIDWVPDDAAPECHLCKLKFTVTNRRVRLQKFIPFG